MIEEMRLRDLGVIAEAMLPIGPGLHRDHGETGAGKTMVVTGPRAAARPARGLRGGALRRRAAEVRGSGSCPSEGAVAERVREAGGESSLSARAAASCTSGAR